MLSFVFSSYLLLLDRLFSHLVKIWESANPFFMKAIPYNIVDFYLLSFLLLRLICHCPSKLRLLWISLPCCNQSPSPYFFYSKSAFVNALKEENKLCVWLQSHVMVVRLHKAWIGHVFIIWSRCWLFRVSLWLLSWGQAPLLDLLALVRS